MRSPRLWMLVILVAVVASILLGYRLRVFAAGGRAVIELALVFALVLMALGRPRPADDRRAG